MSIFLKKLFFSTIIIIALFPSLLPTVVSAAPDTSSKIPEFNPLCWKKSECIEQRKTFVDEDTAKRTGIIENEEPCKDGDSKDPWVKCMPATSVTTSISFGGSNKFDHLGQYLVTVYKYAVQVASVIAVVMLIIAGAQWTLSGGNSSVIEGAKKRIAGALIGLFIAYSSYFILNSINPALVSMRLPQVYLIKSLSMTPQFCSEAPAGTKFAFASLAAEQKKEVTSPKAGGYPLSLPSDKNKFICGNRYFMEKGGNSTCMGNACKKGEICLDFGGSDPNQPFHCENGTIAGTVVYTTSILPCTQRWDDDPIIDQGENELWIVCDDFRTKEIKSSTKTVSKTGYLSYVLTANTSEISRIVSWCGGEKKVKGFAMKVEMNSGCAEAFDDNVFIGARGQSIGYMGYGDRSSINVEDDPEVCKKTVCFLQSWSSTDQSGRANETALIGLIPKTSIIEGQGYLVPTINANNIKTLAHWFFSP